MSLSFVRPAAAPFMQMKCRMDATTSLHCCWDREGVVRVCTAAWGREGVSCRSALNGNVNCHHFAVLVVEGGLLPRGLFSDQLQHLLEPHLTARFDRMVSYLEGLGPFLPRPLQHSHLSRPSWLPSLPSLPEQISLPGRVGVWQHGKAQTRSPIKPDRA